LRRLSYPLIRLHDEGVIVIIRIIFERSFMNYRFFILALCMITSTQQLHCRMPAYSVYQPYNKKNSNTYQQETSTQTLYIPKGQIFTISLENIYTHDYMWYMNNSFFEDTVQLIGKVQIPYRHPGSYGRTIFRFQAAKEGQQIITFSYARPWSWRSVQERTYIINVEKERSFDKNTNAPTMY